MLQKFAYLFLTLLITEEKFESADSLVQNCIEIANYYQLNHFLAKLYLILINLNSMKSNPMVESNAMVRKDMNMIEYLNKVKRIWCKILSEESKSAIDDEEEKNEGD